MDHRYCSESRQIATRAPAAPREQPVRTDGLNQEWQSATDANNQSVIYLGMKICMTKETVDVPVVLLILMTPLLKLKEKIAGYLQSGSSFRGGRSLEAGTLDIQSHNKN